jgi:hypothetical protein
MMTRQQRMLGSTQMKVSTQFCATQQQERCCSCRVPGAHKQSPA